MATWELKRRSTDGYERDGKTVTALAVGDLVRVNGSPVTVLPYRVTAISDKGDVVELASGDFRFSECVSSLTVVS